VQILLSIKNVLLIFHKDRLSFFDAVFIFEQVVIGQVLLIVSKFFFIF